MGLDKSQEELNFQLQEDIGSELFVKMKRLYEEEEYIKSLYEKLYKSERVIDLLRDKIKELIKKQEDNNSMIGRIEGDICWDFACEFCSDDQSYKCPSLKIDKDKKG